jgi:DNA-binding winged helix-turn-helix (wHTH) protein
MVRFGRFVLDGERRQLFRGRDEVHLTPKAFDLLALLIAEAPRVVRKNELHERLWPGSFVSEATLVGLVKEVRRALGDRNRSAPVIRTAHGVGYAFATPLERDDPRASTVTRWLVVGARRITLQDGVHVIGRDPAGKVTLDASGVSRRHAQIVVDAHSAVLSDLGSKNGTHVGDRCVHDAVALQDGDEIRIGPVLIVYRMSVAGISTETIDD